MKPLILALTSLLVACSQGAVTLPASPTGKGGEPESKRLMNVWTSREGLYMDLRGLGFNTQGTGLINGCSCYVVVTGDGTVGTMELSACSGGDQCSTLETQDRPYSYKRDRKTLTLCRESSCKVLY